MVKMIQNMEEFRAELAAAGDNLVVVDFTATWCGPCKMIAPVFNKMSEEPDFSNVVFLKVDVDEGSDIAEAYEINAMPTFLFIKNGEKIDSFSGATEAKLREKTTKYK